MSLKFKFLSTLTVAGAVAAFSSLSMAQDTKTTEAPVTGEKMEHHHRGDRDGAGKRGEFGQRKGGKHGMRGGRGMFGMMRGITLTDAQKEQFKSLRESNKPDKSQFEALRPLMEAKRNGTITADQEAQLKAFREQRQAKAKQMHAQFLSILTDEQKAQLEKNKTEMKANREQFKEKRQEWRKNREDRKTTDKPVIN
jgi:protein CpxP